jgi:DNA repair protein RecO (recombination protein O)
VSLHERTYKANAIVLRTRNLGEADRIYTLFTDVRGKVDAVAKGVRRAKSHIGGRLEFLSEAALTLHRGRSLDVITSVELVVSEWPSLVRPAAFAAGSVVAEVLDAFCEPDLAIPEAYALLRGVIRGLAHSDDPAALVPRFQLRLLDALGLAPAADFCVRCGEQFTGDAAWADVEAGGLSCAVCRPHHSDTYELTADDVGNFRALGAPRSTATRAALQPRPAVTRAVDAFITYHLGKRPRSTQLLPELARANAVTGS